MLKRDACSSSVALVKLVARFITIDNTDARTGIVFSCLLFERYLYLFFLFSSTNYVFVVRAICVFIYLFFPPFLFAINKYLVIYDSYNRSYFIKLSWNLEKFL